MISGHHFSNLAAGASFDLGQDINGTILTDDYAVIYAMPTYF